MPDRATPLTEPGMGYRLALASDNQLLDTALDEGR